MDIRTKLIFALVAVSLVSMLVLGLAITPRVDGYIRNGTLERLDEVAEAKSESLRWIVVGWRDGVDLVASRTQLRAGLDEYTRTGSPSAPERIRTILADAISASRNAILFEVFGADGRSVAAVRQGGAPPAVSDVPLAPPVPGRTAYAGVTVTEAGPPQVTFLAPMIYDGRTIGTLMAVIEAPELVELAQHYHGLGETGETLILIEDESGGLQTLHPTRHDQGRGGGISLPSQPASLGRRALAGETVSIAGNVIDYRGAEVWAATRLIDETGWGLVAKMDRTEGLQPIGEFNGWLRQTAVILSAFAIVAGLFLALRFALPIHALAEVANRIRQGDMDARADGAREDEVGLLARTFNEMADVLIEYRKFFDVSIDLMCIANTDGYFVRTNPAFERELGWTEAELVQRPFYSFVHPDDMERTEREVARLAEGIPTISFENRYLCKNGSYRWLRWTSHPDRGVLYATAHVLDGPTS